LKQWSRQVISVILPVLNETDGINEVINHIRSIDHGEEVEIIIVDGDPWGGTIRAVRDAGAITVISPRGRGRQMNCGAARASGDILLFLHADTLLPRHAFTRIAEVLSDHRFVAGSFDLGLITSRRVFRITEKYVFLRTRLTRLPFGDQAIFIRRDYFKKIGRYQEIPLMEDVELMSRIKKQRGRICVIPEKVMTSVRRWEEEGILYCTFRNWSLQLLYAAGVPPERLVRWYRS
jgi:rSAM/selenodomain-associated transferase 2